MREAIASWLFTYGDDIFYWTTFALFLVFCWFAFVAVVHTLTKDES